MLPQARKRFTRVFSKSRSQARLSEMKGRAALLRLLASLGLERWGVPLLAGALRGEIEHPGAPVVLCLERQNFSKDIVELRRRTRINWLTLRHMLTGQAQVPWTPERYKQQMFYYRESGPEVEQAVARSVRFFRRFLRAVKARGIDAIMSANVDYWHDEPIRLACKAEQIPFLVLSREHYITRAKANERISRYRESGFRYSGAAVAVFGPQTKETMLATGACQPEQVTITGAPRLDSWRDRPVAAGPGNLFLLISFARRQYGAVACNRDTFAEFARFADSCADPSARFVVKCKNEEDRQFVATLAAEFPSPRVQIVLGADLPELLAEARAVIGFNSLALLEALLGPGAICIPHWADAAADPENLMLDPHDPLTRDCVTFAESPQDLHDWLHKVAAGNTLLASRQDRLRLLEQFFHYPLEGTCSDEVARFVTDHVNKPAR